jgi:hypothetical protein
VSRFYPSITLWAIRIRASRSLHFIKRPSGSGHRGFSLALTGRPSGSGRLGFLFFWQVWPPDKNAQGVFLVGGAGRIWTPIQLWRQQQVQLRNIAQILHPIKTNNVTHREIGFSKYFFCDVPIN